MTLRLTVRQAARCYRVGKSTIYRWISEGRMTQGDDGTVDPEEIEQLIEWVLDSRNCVGHTVA